MSTRPRTCLSTRRLRAARWLIGGLVTLLAADCTAPPRQTDTAWACGEHESVPLAAHTGSRGYLLNNLWHAHQGDTAGRQCTALSSSPAPGGGETWTTNWAWSGDPQQVKSYAGDVHGWHWGWRVHGSGLPVPVDGTTPVTTDWAFSVTPGTTGAYDVSYDLWLHAQHAPSATQAPSGEIMLWLDRAGAHTVTGRVLGSYHLAGAPWTLYRDDTGPWPVYKFVRSTDTTAVTGLNLRDFTDCLQGLHLLRASLYLTGIEAGAEVFHGSGGLTTTDYHLTLTGPHRGPDSASRGRSGAADSVAGAAA